MNENTEGSEARFPDGGECALEAGECRLPGQRARIVETLDRRVRPGDLDAAVFGIDQPTEPRTVRDVLLHLAAHCREWAT